LDILQTDMKGLNKRMKALRIDLARIRNTVGL